MILYSAEPVGATVYGAPPGPNGYLFEVPAGKATKVPDEAGRFILQHYQYKGVVRVEETETENGVKWETEKAIPLANELLAQQDRLRFEQYVANCVTDFVQRNKPVPSPPQPILRIIERRGYDLKKFGIIPIGWEEPNKDARVTQLEAENVGLKSQLADLNSKLDLLLKQQSMRDEMESLSRTRSNRA